MMLDRTLPPSPKPPAMTAAGRSLRRQLVSGHHARGGALVTPSAGHREENAGARADASARCSIEETT
jgi:hypothetical protein